MRYLQQVSCSGTICDVELLKMLLEEHHSQICVYKWRASLQELSSFHKDILIVLGVWFFFFPNSVDGTWPTHAVAGKKSHRSSSEVKISTQRSSWIPKEVRWWDVSWTSQFTSCLTRSYIFVYTHTCTYMHILGTFLPGSPTVPSAAFFFAVRHYLLHIWAPQSEYIQKNDVSYCMQTDSSQRMVLKSSHKSSMWLNGIQEFLKAQFNVSKCNQIL